MRVLVVGAASWNALVQVERLPDARSQTVFATDSWDAVGGTSAGKALNLAALGHDVVLHALLGDDEPGARVRDALTGAGIRLLEDVSTSGTEQHVNLMSADGGRLSVYRTLAAAAPYLDLARVVDEAAAADVVLLDLSQHARDLVPRLAGRDVPFWTDLHDWDGVSEFHRPFADHAAVVVLSADALADPAPVCEDLAATGRLVVCTDGARGATAWVDGTVTRVPAVPGVEVVDTNGAGDAFVAGLVHGVHRGWPVERSLRAAALAGATAVTSRELRSERLSAAALEAI